MVNVTSSDSATFTDTTLATSLAAAVAELTGAYEGIALRVLAFASGGAGAAAGAAAAEQVSLAANDSQSVVVGAVTDNASAAGFTPASGTTMLDNVSDSVNTASYGTFESSAPVSSPGTAVSYGATAPGARGAAAALEVTPQGSSVTPAGGPPAVASTSATALATAPYTCPSGGLIVALVAAEGDGSNVTTVSLAGSGMTWTEQAKGNAAAHGYAGVWTAVAPLQVAVHAHQAEGPTALEGVPAKIGVASSDSGSFTEAATGTGAPMGADTATGTEAATVGVSDSDTASGNEAASLGLADSDTASGADRELTAWPHDSDAGTVAGAAAETGSVGGVAVRSGIAGDSGAAAVSSVTVLLPPQWVPGDLAFAVLLVADDSQSIAQTGGTGTWTVRFDGSQVTPGYTVAFASRALAAGDTAPAFGWQNAAPVSWAAAGLYAPGAGVALDAWSGETDTTVAGSTITAPSAAASGADASVILVAAYATAAPGVAAAYTLTGPAGWQAPGGAVDFFDSAAAEARLAAVLVNVDATTGAGTVSPGTVAVTDSVSDAFWMSAAQATVLLVTAASKNDSDTGAGADAASVGTAGSDTATGAENSGAFPSDSDSFAGTGNTGAIGAAGSAPDTLTGHDGGESITVALSAADLGTGTDSASVGVSSADLGQAADATAYPATVTVAEVTGAFAGLLARVACLQNAGGIGGTAAGTLEQVAVTASQAGSVIYGAVDDNASAAGFTPVAGTVLLDNDADHANTASYGTFRAPVAAAGAVTVGVSAPAVRGEVAAAEVLPAGGLSPQATTTAASLSTAQSAVTVAMLLADGLAVALVSGEGDGSNVTTVFAGGGGLAWAEQAKGNTAGHGYAGVWTAAVAPAVTVLEHDSGSFGELGTVPSQPTDADSGQFYDAGITYLADTDVGSFSDGHQTFTGDSDAVTGTDAGESIAVTGTVFAADSDSASGDDEGGWSGPLADSDTGSGLDTATVVIMAADTGAGADGGETIGIAIRDSDTATAVDGGGWSGALGDADSATGHDGGESIAIGSGSTVTVDGFDTAAFTETGRQSGGFSDFDSGSFTDIIAAPLTAASADAGTAAEGSPAVIGIWPFYPVNLYLWRFGGMMGREPRVEVDIATGTVHVYGGARVEEAHLRLAAKLLSAGSILGISDSDTGGCPAWGEQNTPLADVRCAVLPWLLRPAVLPAADSPAARPWQTAPAVLRAPDGPSVAEQQVFVRADRDSAVFTDVVSGQAENPVIRDADAFQAGSDAYGPGMGDFGFFTEASSAWPSDHDSATGAEGATSAWPRGTDTGSGADSGALGVAAGDSAGGADASTVRLVSAWLPADSGHADEEQHVSVSGADASTGLDGGESIVVH